MKRSVSTIAVGALVVACVSVVPAVRASEKGEVGCKLELSLEGWSAFYKTAKGSGTMVASIDDLLGSYAYVDAGTFTIEKAGTTKK
jgi:hypothetical protein